MEGEVGQEMFSSFRSRFFVSSEFRRWTGLGGYEYFRPAQYLREELNCADVPKCYVRANGFFCKRGVTTAAVFLPLQWRRRPSFFLFSGAAARLSSFSVAPPPQVQKGGRRRGVFSASLPVLQRRPAASLVMLLRGGVHVATCTLLPAPAPSNVIV